MMLGGAFIKDKGLPKYLAIGGLLLALVANIMELKKGAPFFAIDVKDMLHSSSFNLTFITVALGCTLIYFLLSGRDIEKVGPTVSEYFASSTSLPSFPPGQGHRSNGNLSVWRHL